MFEPNKITRNGAPSNGSAQKDTPLREASKPLMLQGKMWVIASASGCLPPALASRFTTAETAVLAVVAAEHQKHGRCTLVIDHIAALAGVGRTTVKNALREAQRQSLLRIEERRLSAWRNAPNIVTITSPEWLSWLRMRTRGVGSNPQPPRIQESKKDTSAQRNRTRAAKGQGAETVARQRDS